MRVFNIEFNKKDVINLLFIILSAFIYSININVFVEYSNLFPAGFAGISRLVSEILKEIFNYNLSFSVIFFTMNMTVTFFVFTKLGKKFALYSILWFTLATLFTYVMPNFILTEDKLLNSIFGGIINGASVGLALKNNASSGGTDFIAIYMSIKNNKPMWNYIMGLNIIILFIAGCIFGWENTLYSIIFQYSSTQVIDYMHNRYKITNLFIVTEKCDDVCSAFYKTCRHGITKVNAEGQHTKTQKYILFTTINSFQLPEVISAIKKADPKVFISISRSERIVGNYYQKPLD